MRQTQIETRRKSVPELVAEEPAIIGTANLLAARRELLVTNPRLPVEPQVGTSNQAEWPDVQSDFQEVLPHERRHSLPAGRFILT